MSRNKKPNNKTKEAITEALMKEMHSLMAKHLVGVLKGGEEVTPAMLNVIRQFLKDNNIDGIAREGTPLHELIGTLPEDFGDDDDQKVIPFGR